MKTAMQEIRWFVSDGLDGFDESIKVSEIWEKINELLEFEKQNIIDAYIAGRNNVIYKNNILPLRYYKETFNKNEI
jgi:hypothetical protein